MNKRTKTKRKDDYETMFRNRCFNTCHYALILDKRSRSKKRTAYPLAMRFYHHGKVYLYHVDHDYTVQEFTDICRLSNRAHKSPLYKKLQRFDEIFDYYEQIVEKLWPNINIDSIRIACAHYSKGKNLTFTSIWEERIHHLKNDNNKKQWTTGESYQCALNSFRLILGTKADNGFFVNKDVIEEWDNGMKNGVIQKGKLVGKISDSTRGIYLRACRVMWNICVSRGLLIGQQYPFSNKKTSHLVAIPSSNKRRGFYLSVTQMKALYDVFREKRYPGAWTERYQKDVHYSLGLFLFLYLGNGMNMIDAGSLRYDKFFFDSGKRAFTFARKKTFERSEDGAEVVIPIIEPMQYILDEIAAKPEHDAVVFPHIYQGACDNFTIRKKEELESAAMNARIRRVCHDILGWDIKPSGTWARHSFATNLKLAGVEEQYISECMGHSTHGSVTSIYFAKYPLEVMFVNNMKLLPAENVPSDDELDSMTEDDAKKLLRRLLGRM